MRPLLLTLSSVIVLAFLVSGPVSGSSKRNDDADCNRACAMGGWDAGMDGEDGFCWCVDKVPKKNILKPTMKLPMRLRAIAEARAG